MPYLHSVSLSPDPTYGREVAPAGDNQQVALIYPHRLLRAWPESTHTASWSQNLHLFTAPPPLVLNPGSDGRTGFFLDFATELDAEVVLEVVTSGLANVLFWRGESVLEAEGCIHDGRPEVLISRHIPGTGTHSVRSNAQGFRYVRIEFHDLTGPVTVNKVAAEAVWTFQRRVGDFQCSDTRFQRVWQSSVYTARLCTRPDAIWDGIKRDRHGWYGDARIIKEATDQVFFDPHPAEAMLMKLHTSEWANGIPNYSFDAIAMLKNHILRYGLGRDCIRPTFKRIVELLEWTRKSQVNEDGFIIRVEGQNYAFDMGFLDWSEYPQGGRHEELGWLQATYLAGLSNAADIARMLGEETHAAAWDVQADLLAKKIHSRFWRDGLGYIHTLNHVGQPLNPHHPFIAYRDWHTPRTYKDGIRLGPSGPSRQINAYAILAGLSDERQRRTVLEKVFDNPGIPAVITPYFAYYEQSARARCGDPIGALLFFRDYIGNMLETEDAATIWEYYIPELRDLRRYSSSLDLNMKYPTSLCHGWGAGIVPLTTALLFGITPSKPGFAEITLNPVADLPWSYQATVPTPFGLISVEKESSHAEIHYRFPNGIQIQKDW